MPTTTLLFTVEQVTVDTPARPNVVGSSAKLRPRRKLPVQTRTVARSGGVVAAPDVRRDVFMARQAVQRGVTIR